MKMSAFIRVQVAFLATIFLTGADTLQEQKAAQEQKVTALEAKFRANPEDGETASELCYELMELGRLTEFTRPIAEAMSHYKRALEISRASKEKDPTDENAQSYFADVLVFHAQKLLQQGRDEEAKKEFDESIQILERLHSNNPDDEYVEDLLGGAYLEIADYLEKHNDKRGALSSLDKSLKIRDKLANANPEDLELQFSQAWVVLKYAIILRGKAPYSVVSPMLEKNIVMWEKLSKAEPDDIRPRRNLATSLYNLGLVNQNHDRFEEAISNQNKAIAILEQLLAKEPNLHDAEFSLATLYLNISEAQKEVGLMEESRANLVKAFAAFEKLSDVTELDPLVCSMVGLAYHNASTTENDPDLPTERIQKAIKWQLKAVRAEPENSEFRRQLNDHFKLASILASDTGDPEKLWMQYKSQLDSLAVEMPEAIEIKQAQSLLGYYRAWPLVRLSSGTVDDFKKGLALAEEARKIAPQNYLAINAAGMAQYRLGRYEEALKNIMESIDIFKKAHGDEELVQNLAVLAMIQHRLKKTDEAQATFNRLRELMKDPVHSENMENSRLFEEARKTLGIEE